MKHFLMIALCTIAILASCTQEKKEENNSTAETDSLSQTDEWPQTPEPTDNRPTQVRIDSLLTNIQTLWDAIEAAEDLKITQLELIVREAPYIEGFNNSTLIDRIDRKKKELQKVRFNQETIAQPKVMDAYDNLLAELETHLGELSETTVDIERFPNVYKSLQDFLQSANKDAILRRDYQESVQQYNQILEQEREELSELGKPYNALKPKATFQYGDDAKIVM